MFNSMGNTTMKPYVQPGYMLGRDIVNRRAPHPNTPNLGIFTCLTCGKSFNSKSRLKQHTAVHDAELKYQCEVCMRRFRFRGTRDQHRLTHTGMRPYSCDICGKSFTRSNILKRHRMSHDICQFAAVL